MTPNWTVPTAQLALPVSEAAEYPERWHALRREGVTGTDSATLLGVNHHQTVADLYTLKTGQPEHGDLPGGAIRFGHEMEPVLASEFTDDTGLKLRRAGTYRSTQHPYLLANVDRLTADGGILEIKTAGRASKAGRDWLAGRIPAHAWVQAHHYALVTGRAPLYFSVGIRNDALDYEAMPDRLWRDEWLISQALVSSFTVGPIDPDEELLRQIAERAERFHEAVTARDPSLIDVPPSEPPEVRWRATLEGTEVEAPFAPAALDLIERRRDLKRQAKEVSEGLKSVESQLKGIIGEHEYLTVEGRRLARWYSVATSRLDQKGLKADHPDLAEKYSITTVQRRFEVLGSK